MCAGAMVAEQAAIYSASVVDMAAGVDTAELALINAPLWQIIHPTVERPVSEQTCQLASENTVRLAYGMRLCWQNSLIGLEVPSEKNLRA